MYSSVLALLFLIQAWCGSHENVPEYLRNKYGSNCLVSYHRWTNISRKCKKAELDLEFLQKCKIYHVVPKFLRFKLYRKSLKSANFYRKWQNKLLTNELNLKKSSCHKLRMSVDHHEQALAKSLSTLDMIMIRRHKNKRIKEFCKTTSAVHEKKLAALGVKQILNHVTPMM